MKSPFKNSSASAGFTLIELVLVLAIGGLIFLLAFLAFQQVSTNRRDTERRAALSKVIAELQNSYADNRKYPAMNASEVIVTSGQGTTEVPTFVNTYLDGSNFTGPSGNPYTWFMSTSSVIVQFFNNSLLYVKDGQDIILYARGYKCGGANTVTQDTTNPNALAIAIGLEKGVLCRDVN